MSTLIFMSVSSFIAIKYIRSKKYKFLPSLSFVTSFFGIFISVFALVTTISVMEGFKQEFQKNIIGIRPHIKVYLLDSNFQISSIPNWKEKTLELAKKGILANGGTSNEAMISKNDGKKISGVIVTGMTKEAFEAREILKNGLKEGSFEEKGGILIGQELAFLLGVKLGESINLISPQFRNTPFGSIPVHKTFKVTGIFNVGMHFYDSSFVFLPLRQASEFFDINGASFLEVETKNPNNMNYEIQTIKQTLGNFRMTDWQSENQSFINAINLQKSVMFFILLMFLLLASFIVFSSLSNVVKEKNKTTAILKTLGFNNTQVLLTFFQVGLFAVIPAIIIGLLLGSIFVLNLENLKNSLESLLGVKIFDGAYYFLSYIPSKLEPQVLINVFFISLALSFFAILIPSLKSIKTKPIESLRWE